MQVTLQDMQAAQVQVGPSALREVAMEVPKVGWRDVGGLQAVKQCLQEAVQWPQLHPQSLARLGAQVWHVALLCLSTRLLCDVFIVLRCLNVRLCVLVASIPYIGRMMV